MNVNSNPATSHEHQAKRHQYWHGFCLSFPTMAQSSSKRGHGSYWSPPTSMNSIGPDGVDKLFHAAFLITYTTSTLPQVLIFFLMQMTTRTSKILCAQEETGTLSHKHTTNLRSSENNRRFCRQWHPRQRFSIACFWHVAVNENLRFTPEKTFDPGPISSFLLNWPEICSKQMDKRQSEGSKSKIHQSEAMSPCSINRYSVIQSFFPT